MKRKKLLFLILFMVCFFPAVLIGCITQNKVVPDDYHAAGYQKVVFYYNGGLSGSFLYNEYYIENSKNNNEIIHYSIPVPGGTAIYSPTKTGYNFYGWYEVNFDALSIEKEEVWIEYEDENGEKQRKPVENTKGGIAETDVPYIKRTNAEGDVDTYGAEKILTLKDYEDEQQDDFEGEKLFIGPWNFDFDKVTKDVCLVAIWEPIRYFVVVPPENKSDLFNAEDYAKLPFGNFRANGALPKPEGNDLPKKEGFQVEDFYLDSACSRKVEFKDGYYFPPGEAEFVEGTERFKVFPIYTKWIDEKFTKVDKASAIKDIARDVSYYIMEDLDFTGVSFSTPDIYKGEIRGNGKVWKNLKITITEPTMPNPGLNVYGGIFKNLVGATIKNVTFENLKITFVRRDPAYGSRTTWSNPVKFNVFAKSIDERSSVQYVSLGTENPEESSTFVIMDTIKFQQYNVTVKENGDGHPYRVSYGGNPLLYIPTLKDEYGDTLYDNSGNPLYPENGSTYNGIKINYVTNNVDEYTYREVYAKDSLDGKTLWGNILMPLPSFAPAVTIGQTEHEFADKVDDVVVETGLDKVFGCKNYVERDYLKTPWSVNYEPGNPEPRRLSASDYTTATDLEWAGWYLWDETANEYKRFDAVQITEPVVLIAMWKKIVS